MVHCTGAGSAAGGGAGGLVEGVKTGSTETLSLVAVCFLTVAYCTGSTSRGGAGGLAE